MATDNYLSRKVQLIKTLDRLLTRVKPAVSAWLGDEKASQLIRDSLQEYEDLIPRIPFIGNNSISLGFFFPTTRFIAVYRAFQKQGGTTEDAGRLVFMLGREEAVAIPYPIRRIMGYLWFSHLLQKLMQKRVNRSHQFKYPQDFVLNYVPGDGREFDFGVDYFECANCKFLRAEQAFELAPYVCATDQPVSELMGWGLTRTMTLAEGFPKCDFRFKKGGETRVAIPQSLQAHLGLAKS